jgi:hypothetical protein
MGTKESWNVGIFIIYVYIFIISFLTKKDKVLFTIKSNWVTS